MKSKPDSAYMERIFKTVRRFSPMRLHPRTHTPLREVFQTLFITFRVRTFLALALMMAQAFFYNAIFFTYALVLTNFYDVPSYDVGWYILPFALGNVRPIIAWSAV